MLMTKLLQSDIDYVKKLCLENDMIFNFGEPTIITFARKTISINFKYKLCNYLILRPSVLKILVCYVRTPAAKI
jgi:hypothetical protein